MNENPIMITAHILRNLLIVTSLATLLSACASVTAESTSPDNKKVYGIDCSGKAISMSACYEKAQDECPNGYTIISNNAPGVDYSWKPTLEIGQAIADEIPGVKKGITVECR